MQATGFFLVTSKITKTLTDIAFSEISERIRNINLPTFDAVVAIARGGIVPGALLAFRFQKELFSLQLNYRDDDNKPRFESPRLMGNELSLPEGIKTILLVDDVSVSGKTLDAAKTLLPTYSIITFVLKGKGDFSLFPEVKDCVNWPWKERKQ
ncbi:MAG: hypothetical protein JJU28_20695 [Cyclobacteriaceae bacterium]|nr:hypothetical protein [Cyclobacteriaceae bacterium]